ncbi:MAG: DcaP family trimeric outer membrane transporter [Candidatus Abyssubacteria bacterium]
MKNVVLFLCIAALGLALVSPAWGNPESDDLQALKEQVEQLNKLLQSQQQKLEQQDIKLQEQQRKINELEQKGVEPVTDEEMEVIIERVKGELPPSSDGLTIGGGKIRLTPYGFIRLDAAYDDSANFLFSGNVVGWAFPEGGTNTALEKQFADEDDESFSMTATATRLGLNFLGPEFAGGNIKGQLEIDFDELSGFGGDVVAHRIRMRHAYAELQYPTWSLLAGQTWDVIGPKIPYMLDCVVLWGSGNVGYRRPQLRLTKWVDIDGTKLTGQFSLNHQDRSLSDNIDKDINLLNGVESGWPLTEARLAVDTVIFGERKLGFGVYGMIGEEEVDWPASRPGAKENLDVWLVGIDGSLTIIPKLVTIQGELWVGENTDNVYGGIVQGTVIDKNDPTKLDEIEAYGGFIHAMITPRPGLLFNVGYGLDDVDSGDMTATNFQGIDGFGNRSQNWTVFGNVIYTVVPNFDVGLELAWHETKWVGMEDGDLFRIQTAFIYKF